MTQNKTKMAADRCLKIGGPPNSPPTFLCLRNTRMRVVKKANTQKTVTENAKVPGWTWNTDPLAAW